MVGISESERIESLTSLRSSIAKTTKGLASMEKMGANTTVAKKRLEVLSIGLAVLEHIWVGTPQQYSPEALSEAREVLADLLPSIQSIYGRSKTGSAQKTLLERRIVSLKRAIRALDKSTVKNPDTLPSSRP